jgi:hypothetical protein
MLSNNLTLNSIKQKKIKLKNIFNIINLTVQINSIANIIFFYFFNYFYFIGNYYKILLWKFIRETFRRY